MFVFKFSAIAESIYWHVLLPNSESVYEVLLLKEQIIRDDILKSKRLKSVFHRQIDRQTDRQTDTLVKSVSNTFLYIQTLM
jgi:hypothetical protein